MPIALQPDDGSLNCYTATRKTSSTKTVKNHLSANRKALKERQKSNKDAALEEKKKEDIRMKKLQHKKEKMFGNIKSRVWDPTASSPKCPPTATSKSRAAPAPSDTDSNASYHIVFGRKIPAAAKSSRSSISPGDHPNQQKSNERHKSYGKIPTYIINRREKIERQEEERRRLQENAPPAPGLVLMAESERVETLRLLEENEEKERTALRNIPFSMNGHRAARLREAIEFRLREIEDARRYCKLMQ